MPILKSFLGCMSLKTGTIVCGVIGLTSTLTLILLQLASVSVFQAISDDSSSTISKIILCTDLVITILLSVALIVGAIKKNKWCLLPSIVLNIFTIIIMTTLIIYESVERFDDDEIVKGTLTLLVGLGIVGVNIYLWLVILSFYQQLTEEGHGA